MPALPVSVLDPIWAQIAALLPVQLEVDAAHPLGCHHRRIPDRVVFAHVVDALVHGLGYERIASPGCSNRTIRRVHAWAPAGLTEHPHMLGLTQLRLRSVFPDFGRSTRSTARPAFVDPYCRARSVN